jgi:hypothetical protein
MPAAAPARLNIYLEEDLRTAVRISAARRGISVSALCAEVLREVVSAELPAEASRVKASERVAAARGLDRLRRRIGPIGVPVADLVRAGRRR